MIFAEIIIIGFNFDPGGMVCGVPCDVALRIKYEVIVQHCVRAGEMAQLELDGVEPGFTIAGYAGHRVVEKDRAVVGRDDHPPFRRVTLRIRGGVDEAVFVGGFAARYIIIVFVVVVARSGEMEDLLEGHNVVGVGVA